MAEYTLSIGDRIALLRGDVSQEETADRMKQAGFDISKETLGKWELGKRRIKADDLEKLAKYFDVSSDYLLGLTEVKSSEITIRKICDTLGLSEQAVKNIFVLKLNPEPSFKRYLDMLNMLLSVHYPDLIGGLIQLCEAEDELKQADDLREQARNSSSAKDKYVYNMMADSAEAEYHAFRATRIIEEVFRQTWKHDDREEENE